MATGFLHPGAMGASLAAACGGSRLWCSEDRSEATRARARAAGMQAVASLDALLERADVLVSVCPPSAATEVARSVAEAGFDGIYVDVNAISPMSSRQIGQCFARFVDGGVIGPPAHVAGTTRLYLSGDSAAEVAALWNESVVETRLVEGGAGAASAVKICYAAWTKGSAALLLATRALASAAGVERALLDEWATSIPGLTSQSQATAAGNAPKAWRFVGELEEIADTFAAFGLPDGFAAAAAEVYHRMAGFKNTTDTSVADVIEALVEP
jgi:3-hydroxyisobutyrate dehydrogenase-like beta-hydroxyacid dehydrogenase